MSDTRDNVERPPSTEASNSVKIEPVRNLAGGALVRAIPAGQPARLMMTTPIQASAAALISTTSSVQAQTVSKSASAQVGQSASVAQQTVAVSRVSTIPIQTTSGTSFHVPRGAAAVANIAVPRSSTVATPIIRGQAALQAIGVPSTHSITGAAGASSAIQVGRSIVGNVSPWAVSAISTGPAVARQPIQQLRAPLQQMSAPSDSDVTSTSTSPNPCVSIENSDDGAKIVASVSGQQIRPHPDSQRPLLVHSTTHKQLTLTQAQVGQGDGKTQPLLKSYRATSQPTPAARVVTQSSPGLSRISSATMPQAMVTLHPAAVLVNSSQAIPIKSATPQAKVLAQPAPSTVQFSPVPVSSVQSALTISTSRPGVVTVMLAGTGATAPTLGVTPIRPQQSSQPTGQQTGSTQLSSPVFIQTQNLQPTSGITQQVQTKPQQLPAGTLIVREQRQPSKDDSVPLSSSGGTSTSGSAATVIGLPTYSLSSGSYYEATGFQMGVAQRASIATTASTVTSMNPAVSTPAISTSVPTVPAPSSTQPMPQHRPTPIPLPSTTSNTRSTHTGHLSDLAIQPRSIPISFSSSSDGLLSESISTSSNLSSQLQLKNTSPRPSILRKREPDGSPLKAQKNLTPILTSLAVSTASNLSAPSGSGSPLGPSSPKRPESGNSGQSSSSSTGSTTISANSSPGESPTAGVNKLEERPNDDEQQQQQRTSSFVAAAAAAVVASQHRQQQSSSGGPGSQIEMSPRKKPRKQQLTGNQIPREPNFNEAEMEFITEDRLKKDAHKEDIVDEEDKALPKARMPLLKSYRHPWRGRNNHFLRSTDIKVKEDKKSVSLTEYANQKHAIQKLNGWKVYHIASQMEDMISYETGYSDTYEDLLNGLENLQKKCKNRDMEKDFQRVCERVRANLQRSRVVKDHINEARTQAFKLFDHKNYVSEILSRHIVKRTLKKRERL